MFKDVPRRPYFDCFEERVSHRSASIVTGEIQVRGVAKRGCRAGVTDQAASGFPGDHGQNTAEVSVSCIDLSTTVKLIQNL